MDIRLSCMTWLHILYDQLRQTFTPKHRISSLLFNDRSFLDDSSICHNSLSSNDPCDDPRDNISSLHENSLFLLPDDIIINIFSRLDAECVFQCSRVCRSLSVILSSPYFNFVHCSRATPSLIVHCLGWQPKHDESGVDGNTIIHYVDVVSGNIVELRMKIKSRNVWPNIEYMPFLVGSYNGLLLFRNLSDVDSVSFLWNPVTQEQVTVIAPKVDYHVCGFFLNSQTGEFRVLYMRYNLPISQCLILSLRTNLLREVSFCSLFPCTRRPPVILNRKLHWIVRKDLSNPRCHSSSLCSKLILVFKIDSEVFSTIPHPQIENCTYGRHRRMHLLEMEGRLCVCDVTSATDLDLWVLQEKKVWIKMHKISTKSVAPEGMQREDALYTQPYLEALCIQNNELLLKCLSWKLYYYNLKQKTFRAINTGYFGWACLSSVVVHSNSIASPHADEIIILSG
ncbi:hypothetical protein FRX31_013744 [Thalictrum thalictroides]|uniref:F-box domain-containing protein n=1 Tax=Thalictrum thalictroides TaxID=46969 RepID=A0A7J6WH41_THATH|nr:hypothetical protein FRX31_013744 [Thalictrum thalictroides]